jgi:hypothetical protein
VGYLIAAYAIGVGGVVLYGLLLARERRRLLQTLARGADQLPVDNDEVMAV